MNFTKVISTKFDDTKRLLVKFLRMGKSDVQECIEVSSYGVDSNPVKDMVALYVPTGETGKNAIIGYINKERLADVGEYRIFSTDDSGALKTYIWLHNDGTMEIGGDADNMVRFSELETAFNQLKDDHNALAQKWDAFCLAYVPGSPSTTGLPATLGSSTVGQSTADISGAKIDEVLTL
jgi:hypothetical protein